MKLAIVGSRHFTDFNFLEKEILSVFNMNEITEIISGGAKGVDTLAEQFADKHNIKQIFYPNLEKIW